ncbi:AI-2E family transporter [Fusibacter bizertensis]|uniref:AI-2E family transporter n=1 Tax=Fusibacter bizertensis TaxID=1488331 RepID=A0ABT6N814_9FIRM|nr:AI-2E family transporter [Fusibacter bizertensis]MDH8676555.1 AI-2E family transporter [Fusibacter bizertensis]
MNLRDIKITSFSKLIIVATVLILILTKTALWKYIAAALAPILMAFILAYIMDYVVRFLEKRVKLSRMISILITVVLFIALLTLLGFVIFPNIVEAVASLIKAIGAIDMTKAVDFSFLNQIDFNNIYLKQLQQTIVDTLTPMLQKLTNFTGTAVMIIVNQLQQITSGLISFLISFVIALYMLAEKNDLIARIKRLLYAYFNDKQVQWVFYISRMSDMIFKDFVIGKLIDSTIIGLLSYFIFVSFGFEYSVVIALIVGITNMIPYFGPFIGAIPAGIITLIANPTHPIDVVYILLLILIIQQLDGLVIGPFILGDSVGVSAFWIIVAVTIGGASFGILGMFLGVPVCVLIKTLIEEDIERKLAAKGYDGLEEQNLRFRKKHHKST